MKIIIIGTSLSGKTTLVRYLRTTTNFPVSEIDEELVKLNGGIYPKDLAIKTNILTPKIIGDILGKDDIIFFTTTDYFTENDLKKARDRKFKIVQLILSVEELEKRNKDRIGNEGYDDMKIWLAGMLQYQKAIQEKGLVDRIIDANRPTNKIAKELLEGANG